MRLVLFYFFTLILPSVLASTVTTKLILSKTETAGTSFTALAHPTPYVVLTDAGTINVYGISATGAVTGDVVVVTRVTTGTINFYHNDVSAGASDKIYTPRGMSPLARTGPMGLELIYISGVWYVTENT